MAFIQFRIHPGVGCARMGNSKEAYHLASEFPYFLQEEFPNLRFKPKPRTNPRKFFDTNPTGEGDLTKYDIYHSNAAFKNVFKEAEGKIFPQGVRFRVFAYVYDDGVSGFPKIHPRLVFEVTADMADITWKVDIANKKSQKSTATVPDENSTATTFDLVTSDTKLLCKRVRPVSTRPTLAYMFLERDDADKKKVTGRLHVIGNEGEVMPDPAGALIHPISLWSDDWYDSAGDGSVQAIITPKGDAVQKKAGASDPSKLKYLSYNTDAAQPGTTASITAMPAWVVIGCPDYVPDMGHFVSLYDIGLDRGFTSIGASKVIAQPGKHKLIRGKTEFNSYRQTDYLVHIHPHLCLFDDVKFVSGEANGDPEELGPNPVPTPIQAHNIHPPTAPPPPDPDPAKTEKATIQHGGIIFNARVIKSRLQDAKDLKDTDPSKPILEWMKRAVYTRLRKPKTLYDIDRLFFTLNPDEGGSEKQRKGTFPRKVGRRMDYDRASGGDKNKMWEMPGLATHNGNLRVFHGLKDAGKLCGTGNPTKSPPTAGPPGRPSPSPEELLLLPRIDDMYWPATVSDMPMLRELAYTQLQYDQFQAWALGTFSDVRYVEIEIFEKQVLTPALKTLFTTPGSDDAEKHIADYIAQKPLFAPAIIDMAAMGAMLGGSFLPGIEVGREAGIAGNWCLFHGPNEFFPTIRFKPVASTGEHTHGTLTKDLAIPWTDDFRNCDEKFWPTSRPGKTKKTAAGARVNWQIELGDRIPHLGAPAGTTEKFVQEFWKALGFIRRTPATNEFFEKEQSWH